MNNLRNTVLAISALTLFLVISFPLQSISQTKYTTNGAAKITINGTSNIHDWTMESTKGNCNATFTLDAAGNVTSITGLGFTMQVNNLKSEHGSQMDNNAYKAMNAEKYPNITFSSASATVQAKGGGAYTITAPGKLQISNGVKDVTLVGSGKMNADKSFTINGSYKLITTDYNVKTISIMLGAIKTQADVKIDYALVMKPQ